MSSVQWKGFSRHPARAGIQDQSQLAQLRCPKLRYLTGLVGELVVTIKISDTSAYAIGATLQNRVLR